MTDTPIAQPVAPSREARVRKLARLAIARIINEVVETDDESCGEAYMRAADEIIDLFTPDTAKSDAVEALGDIEQYRVPSWARSIAFSDAAAECDRCASQSRHADNVSDEQRKGYKIACGMLSASLQVMAREVVPAALATPTAPSDQA